MNTKEIQKMVKRLQKLTDKQMSQLYGNETTLYMNEDERAIANITTAKDIINMDIDEIELLIIENGN